MTIFGKSRDQDRKPPKTQTTYICQWSKNVLMHKATYVLWFNIFLVQNFSNLFDFYFPLFNSHYHNRKQRKIKIKLVWKNLTKNKFKPQHVHLLKFTLIPKLWHHKYAKLYVFFNRFSVLSVNSNPIQPFIKEDRPVASDPKKIETLSLFLRILGISNSRS